MRILVIGGDSPLVNSLRKSLQGIGYVVDIALDGTEGLYRAKTWDYDAVILDDGLPGQSGLEVLGELRRSKSTPVLMLGNNARVEDRIQYLDSGADDCLVKPFELDELHARLRVMIRRAGGNSCSTIHIGDVLVNTVSRTIRKAGKEVSLTAQEYSLVEVFALHRGNVVTRSMLFDHLHRENGDSLSNLIEVHICNIRRKLGKDFITTRRGLGYLIEA